MPVFAIERDPNAHEAFVDWIGGNPTGFVINCKSSQNIMMHLATCGHFKPLSEWAKANSLKACSLDRTKLENWAEVEGLKGLKHCHCLR